MTGLDGRLKTARDHLDSIPDNRYLGEREMISLKMTVQSILDFLEDRFAPCAQAVEDDRKSTPVETFNRFFACETVTEVISQAVGAGSTCWFDQKVPTGPHGYDVERVFDSEEALRIADEAEAQIKIILDRQKAKLAPRDMKPGLIGGVSPVDKSQIPPYTINEDKPSGLKTYNPVNPVNPVNPINKDAEYLYGAFGLNVPGKENDV